MRGTSNKFQLTASMRYVNRHLGQNAFRFEGLKDLVAVEGYLTYGEDDSSIVEEGVLVTYRVA